MRVRNRIVALPLVCFLTFVSATLLARVVGFGQPQIGAVHGTMPILHNQKIVNFGHVVYTGNVDVNPTVNRIRQGTKLNHNNDGAIYTNVERTLPTSSDSQYYREFVVNPHISGITFPGPERLIIGKNGVVYYTGDHYSHFARVN